jgi:hypothetical protein
MRSFPSTVALTFALLVQASAPAQAQTACTGLCLQQVQCPAGQTTSISGTVFAPNNTDPLPNILVYIPNATVDPFTPGVSCPVVGTPPSGSPLVGTTSAVDGTFTITNVPVGTNVPLVIQSGRWRRQVTVPSTTACANTSFSTRFPKNQTEGDIPLFAVATGGADNVECVLRKVGIDDHEFTDPSAGGRIQIYSGSGGPGALIDSSTPSQTTLMENLSTLENYDVLMLPCQGKQYLQDANSLANFRQFANDGGRVYASHFSYVWLYDNPPFDSVANWAVNGKSNPLDDGYATVATDFSEGVTLSAWLQLVGASSTPGQIYLNTNKHDFDGVNPPNQSWLTLNDAALNNPVMQFVFNTPLNGINQCGRVLFNEYHVETKANNTDTTNATFPNECNSGTITAQEKLLEFSLFELTSNGSAATLTPNPQDFGSVPVGFPSAPQTFTWTNNSTFPASASPTTSGDYAVTNSSGCNSVAAGASCAITVVFTPTALGARPGVLTVASNGNSLPSTLTGTGIPDISVSASTLAFGNLDVGASATQNLIVTNNASGPVAFPLALTSGAFTEKSFCPATLPAGVTCGIAVTFTPPSTGPQSSSLTLASGIPAAVGLPVRLTGNGVDFSIAATPTSGSVIAGYNLSMSALTSPIAGYNASVTLTCNTNAPASTCTPASSSFAPATPTTTAVAITTISRYTVVGYGSFGAPGSNLIRIALWLLALTTAALISLRRRASTLGRRALLTLLLTAAALAATLPLSGCSGKLPAQNASYTPPGSYTYTLTATDGFLTHTATYTLKVTSN